MIFFCSSLKSISCALRKYVNMTFSHGLLSLTYAVRYFCILNIFRPNLTILEKDASHLQEVITNTSVLAENVSSKVRQLDLAKVSQFSLK